MSAFFDQLQRLAEQVRKRLPHVRGEEATKQALILPFLSALGYDIYRLAIAVTAISLLISPAWTAMMHRLESVAQENYDSYRHALSEAYAGEIENVGDKLWWLKVRYRAGRIARRKRREAKAANRAAAQAAALEAAEEKDTDAAEQPDKKADASA